MKTVFLLIGVSGAGKTTLLSNLKKIKDNSFYIMSSSTTRPPRESDDFILHEDIKKWNDDDYLYHISIGDKKYGLRKSEVDKIQNSQIGITLYSPSSFKQIEEDQKNNPNIQFVTIGIDTIDNIEEQKIRVGNDESRFDTPEDFDKYLEIIRNDCSITIKGDEKSLVDQICTIGNLFIHGGVISGIHLSTLLNNHILIDKCIFDEQKIECASYNMHLGNQYKNSDKNPKNRMIDASNNDDLLEIEPYSYIIVQPIEKINLPTFVTAKFDLTVGVFQKGVILSASTQVDPGFKGVITCLLYNPSDSKITLKVNDEFLTIEFYTTTINTKGYKGKRKDKTLNEQLSPEAITQSSNKLSKIAREETWKFILKDVAVPIIIALVSCIFSYFQCKGAKKEVDSLKNYIDTNVTVKSESSQSQSTNNNFYFSEAKKEETQNDPE